MTLEGTFPSLWVCPCCSSSLACLTSPASHLLPQETLLTVSKTHPRLPRLSQPSQPHNFAQSFSPNTTLSITESCGLLPQRDKKSLKSTPSLSLGKFWTHLGNYTSCAQASLGSLKGQQVGEPGSWGIPHVQTDCSPKGKDAWGIWGGWTLRKGF